MRAFSYGLFLFGTALLVINAVGLVVQNDQREAFGGDLLSYDEAFAKMDASFADHGASPVFFENAVQIYNDSINYVWPENLATIPVYDNYLLYMASFFDEVLFKAGLTGSKKTFSLFESANYERGFRRGFGICSQNALGLTDILDRRYGVEANMVGLDGHVVLSARDGVNGARYLLDPSVGVFMPFDLDHAEKNVGDVIGYYRSTEFPELGEKYNPQGNVLFTQHGSAPYRPTLFKIEFLADVMKWVIPVLFYGLGFLLTASIRRKEI